MVAFSHFETQGARHVHRRTNTFAYRGNVYSAATPTGTQTFGYDMLGNLLTTNGVAGTASVAMDSSKNYAVPASISSNSATTTMQWNSALNLTQDTGANSQVMSVTYDGYSRPAGSQSPYGATISFGYTANAKTSTTVNGKRQTNPCATAQPDQSNRAAAHLPGVSVLAAVRVRFAIPGKTWAR